MEELRASEVSVDVRWWTASILVTVIVAIGLGAAAVLLTIESLRPVGEGELLAAEAAEAAGRIAGLPTDVDLETELRHLRNDLEIEALAVVDPEGVVVASTSGFGPVHPILRAGLAEGRFAALAEPITAPVSIDGVVEWQPGDVLYLALEPLDDGRGVVLTYDISELLERRAAATRTPPIVIPLAIGSGLFLLSTGVLVGARARALRIRRELALEAEYLRRRTEELEELNLELERARMEVERALDLAEEKNRIRSEFVLMINHELRTPLTGIVTGAQLLASVGELDMEQRLILDDLIEDGGRLERLIGQMLAVARVENRGLVVNPVFQPLGEVVGHLRRAHEWPPVRVLGGLDVDATKVSTDATTLGQLVVLLVDNAYTHGARRVEIAVSRSMPGVVHHRVGPHPPNCIFVMVVDDGPGFDPDFLPRAFEKFEKSSFSSGTGLGLYMAQMMADSVGSSISVSSTPGGTVMSVALSVEPIGEAVR